MKRIVVPIDFSAPALNALKYAIEMHEGRAVELLLLHVIEYPIPVGLEFGIVNSELSQEQLNDSITLAKKQLDTIIASLPKNNLTYKKIVEAGSLPHWVRNHLSDYEPDLVVMGTTGATGLKGVFVGSNTEKVVRNAACPVISIPAHSVWGKVKSLVVPVEDEKIPELFYEKLKRFQSQLNARIELIWINTPHSLENEQEMIHRIIAGFNKNGIKNFKINTRRGFSASNGILQFAQEVNAQMVAMPTHGKKGLAHLFIDSTTTDIVNQSFLPVWSVNIGSEVSTTV